MKKASKSALLATPRAAPQSGNCQPAAGRDRWAYVVAFRALPFRSSGQLRYDEAGAFPESTPPVTRISARREAK